jgi:tryptophanase
MSAALTKSRPGAGFSVAEDLGVIVPSSYQYVVRNTKKVTREERERVQRMTEYNCFAFPSSLLICDYLSDSGTTSMTDLQWSALMRGDEAYGRNSGYYALLDALRDTFERGDKPQKLVDLFLSDETRPGVLIPRLMQESEGGFVNGGAPQLARPNAFITPQGRGAEYLLFSTMRSILDKRAPGKEFTIPSNGFFDTTEAHAHVSGFRPKNLFCKHFHDEFDAADLWTRNPFKGDINIEALRALIAEVGADAVPIILITVTNNTAAGQPVSMANLVGAQKVAAEFDIPLILDACRFAENARFIQEFEEGYKELSIQEIVRRMFALADGFTISLKKDGMANIGGAFCFRDRGVFHRKFSSPELDVGIAIKEKQIVTFGNDSYGALSGRDIMAVTVGLYEVVKQPYLIRRIEQTRRMAAKMAARGVPTILPPGGHAVYIDMGRFFDGMDMKTGDFGGVGFVIELLRHYGIRACELGPFAFEWDMKSEEARKGILNLVRFAIPRNAYNEEHIDYTVAAVEELHEKRHLIPKVEVCRGRELHLRHFQSGLKPIYPLRAKL